jgi:hypothetical protein
VTTQTPKRWYSLGFLFGGFTPANEKVHAPIEQLVPRAAWLAEEEADKRRKEAEEAAAAERVARAAGFIPDGPYPGRKTVPWPSKCAGCGAQHRPTLYDIETGVRCSHTRKGRTP